MQECCKTVCDDMEEVQTLMTLFRSAGKAASLLFSFWDTYIEMVQLLLQFIRAERDGHWKLHLETTSRMVPFFFTPWTGPTTHDGSLSISSTCISCHRNFLKSMKSS